MIKSFFKWTLVILLSPFFLCYGLYLAFFKYNKLQDVTPIADPIEEIPVLNIVRCKSTEPLTDKCAQILSAAKRNFDSTIKLDEIK